MQQEYRSTTSIATVLIQHVRSMITQFMYSTKISNYHYYHHHSIIQPILNELSDLEYTLIFLNDDDLFDQIIIYKFLKPFLDIITNEHISSSITAHALLIIYRLLNSNILAKWLTAPNCGDFIADGVNKTKFSSITAGEDTITINIISVLRQLLICEYGDRKIISNDTALKCFDNLCRICFEFRFNNFLRRTAELSLIDIVTNYFSSLQRSNFRCKTGPNLANNIDVGGRDFAKFNTDSISVNNSLYLTTNFTDCDHCGSNILVENDIDNKKIEATTEEPNEIYFNDVQCRILKFLIDCTEITEGKYTNATNNVISIGLALISCALESAGRVIVEHMSMLNTIKTDLCRNLCFLLIQSDLNILSNALQVIVLLFDCHRSKMKLQLGRVFSVMLIQIKNEATHSDRKELIMFTISRIMCFPSIMQEFYLNYDCDLHSENILQHTFETLSKMSTDKTMNNYPLNNINIISINAINAITRYLYTESSKHSLQSKASSREILTNLNRTLKKYDFPAMKQKKKDFMEGIEIFNSNNPKKGLEFLSVNGFLPSPLTFDKIAQFLRVTSKLDNRIIGEFISARQNTDILDEYMRLFDFSNLRLDEALRYFVEAFRLPGEAPLIGILMEKFADSWKNANVSNTCVKSSGAAFSLAFAVILLNVDQHNHNVKKQTTPMNISSFVKNLSGMNDGENFEESMLGEIYNAVSEKEIVMPSEQIGIVKEKYMWKVIGLIDSIAERNVYTLLSPAFLSDVILKLVWPLIYQSIASIIDVTNNEYLFEKLVATLSYCAEMACRFGCSDIFEEAFICIGKSTKLNAKAQPGNTVLKSMLSDSSVQCSVRSLFRISKLCADVMNTVTWDVLIEHVVVIMHAGLLPDRLRYGIELPEKNNKKILLYNSVNSMNHDGFESSIFNPFNIFMSSQPDTISPISTSDDLLNSFISDLSLDQVLIDTKLMHLDSLTMFVIKIVDWCNIVIKFDDSNSLAESMTDHIPIMLELLAEIFFQNRDRPNELWLNAKLFFYNSIMILVKKYNYLEENKLFILDRVITTILRISRVIFAHETLAAEANTSLKILFVACNESILAVSQSGVSIACTILNGLNDFISHFHLPKFRNTSQWTTVISLLLAFGGGWIVSNLVQPELICHHEIRSAKQEIVSEGNSQQPFVTLYTRTCPSIIVPNVIDNPATTIMGNQMFWDIRFRCLAICLDAFGLIICDDPNCLHDSNYFLLLNCMISLSELASSYQSLKIIYSDPFNRNYYEFCVSILELFYRLCCMVERIFCDSTVLGRNGITMNLHDAHWFFCWKKILHAIFRFSYNCKRSVRRTALNTIQRCIMIPGIQYMSVQYWGSFFNELSIPMLSVFANWKVMSNETFKVEESAIRASQFLCKVFLQKLQYLRVNDMQLFEKIWMTLIVEMQRLVSLIELEMLRESVCESVKNMVLVMIASGYFGDKYIPKCNVDEQNKCTDVAPTITNVSIYGGENLLKKSKDILKDFGSIDLWSEIELTCPE
ncbi:hypothetical protein GJ496_011092, partial [Pomphorhynchus laevis]